MRKRTKMSSKRSKKLFSKTANKTHKFNLQRRHMFMRGGIRL